MGALIGLLANVARLRPPSWKHMGWLTMAGMGALLALCGGWLGVFLLSRYLATPMALWIAIGGIVLICKGLSKLIPFKR